MTTMAPTASVASHDLVSFAFGGPAKHVEQFPIYIDAKDPTLAVNEGQMRQLVRSLVAGFNAHHVQRGDRIVVQLDNFVSN